MTPRAPLGRWIAWAGALAWSVGLIAFAFAPTYSTVRSGPDGTTIRSTESLVSENGTVVLVAVAVPLAVSLLVGLALLFSRHQVALTTAWFLTGVLGVFNFLALLTIGLLVVPVTAALIAACALSAETPARSRTKHLL